MKALRRLLSCAMLMLASACSDAAFTAANLPGHFDDTGVTHDIAYGPEPWQKLDIYIPASAKNSTQPLDVVFFLYGGRWEYGAKDQYAFVGNALADRGFIAVIPDYTKYPAVKFPTFVQDGAKALAWTADHIAEYNGNPQRMHVTGHSAGAYIGAMLTVDAAYLKAEGKDRDQVIYDYAGLAGPYSFTPMDMDLQKIFGPPGNYPRMQAAGFIDGHQPPMLLQWGEKDITVSYDNIAQLQTAAMRQGGCLSIITYRDIDHVGLAGALSWYNPQHAPVLDDMVAFFRSPPGLKCARDPAVVEH